MRISLGALNGVLQRSVAEIKFERRRMKPGHPPFRRMLCTNDTRLLESARGRTSLNYRPSNRPVKKYNPASKNLLITWDIFMQDYRNITVDNCELVSVIPTDDRFWAYFSDQLIGMSAKDKERFMDV